MTNENTHMRAHASTYTSAHHSNAEHVGITRILSYNAGICSSIYYDISNINDMIRNI